MSLLRDLLLARSVPEPNTGCWLWTGCTDHCGYGLARDPLTKKCRRTHILSYQAFVGPVTEGLLVLHSCDNATCCNPEHLSLGTAKDNARDRGARGRHAGRAPVQQANQRSTVEERTVRKTLKQAQSTKPHGPRRWHVERRSTLAERIARKSAPQANGCVLWTGSLRGAYPTTSFRHKHVSITRWVLGQKLSRELLPGEFACHTCDNPRCVSSEHLFAGTAQDNRDDCVAKARHTRGASVNTSKFTEQQVLSIRARVAGGESRRAVARDLKVCKTSIARIVSGKNWKHV